MRFRIIQVVIASIILTLSCNTKKEKAQISAEIQNLDTDTILITISPYNQEISYYFDTILCTNGKFSIDTLINEIHYGYIVPNGVQKKLSNGNKFPIPSKIIKFFIYPNGNASIKGKIKDFKTEYVASGNILNDQFSEYRANTIDNYELECKLMYDVENLYIQNSPDSIIDKTYDKMLQIRRENKKSSLEFIKQNQNLEISAFLLQKEEKEDILNLFSSLSESVKESVYGKLVQEKINIWKQTEIGSTAPDFEYLTFKNDTFKLSDNKGEYVVLDFWGSWCKSCIKGFPKMKKYYDTYNSRLEFVSIACEDKRSDWIKALEKYNLPWIQILNNSEAESNLAIKYGVKGYPTKFIINSEGIIEGVFTGETEDFYNKLDSLLKE